MQFIIFGATGDLSIQKIYPALYHLESKNKLNKNIQIIGISRRDWGDEEYKDFVNKSLENKVGRLNQNIWEQLKFKLQFVNIDFENPQSFERLKEKLNENLINDKFFDKDIIFYFATAPKFFDKINFLLKKYKILDNYGEKIRIVIEKPFGSDYKTAKTLSQKLHENFNENQIYRIDHVLNKDALLDIIEFRKYNQFFNSLFSKQYVDHIQITYSEKSGINSRGNFYEQVGALRDMVQSHILQIITLILVNIEDVDHNFHKARAKIIESLDILSYKDIVLGQYTDNIVDHKKIKAYTQEKNVDPESQVETFVGLKLHSTLPNWKKVPIYLRTGKRLKQKYLDVNLVFKNLQEQKFGCMNYLSFRIKPLSGVSFSIYKYDQNNKKCKKVILNHCYRSFEINDAYENLMKNVLKKDHVLFISELEILESWKLIDKIREKYKKVDLEKYLAGTSGPHSNIQLIEKDNRVWLDGEETNFCQVNSSS